MLAPVGSALLGLKVRRQHRLARPGRSHHRVEILEVVYQPERAGELHR